MGGGEKIVEICILGTWNANMSTFFGASVSNSDLLDECSVPEDQVSVVARPHGDCISTGLGRVGQSGVTGRETLEVWNGSTWYHKHGLECH